MAIGAYFHPAAMTAAQYDAITSQLQQAGFGAPQGRLFHSAFMEGESMAIYDIWDSQAEPDAFFGTLGPILAQAGLDPGEPSIVGMHNIIWGAH